MFKQSFGPLADWQIRERCEGTHPMLEPFISELINKDENGNKLISYGTSSFGYDAQLADEFKVFTNLSSGVIDPKNFNPESYVDVSGKGYCIIPPNSFALARTVEYFRIPKDIIAICVGKSTLARVGINVICTPLEPGWEGHVTLEFANAAPLPVKLYANEGAAQFIFLRGAEPETSYADRNGKYQGQTGITLARV